MPEAEEKPEIISSFDASDVFKELDSSEEALIHPYTVGNRQYHIKTLSLGEILSIHGKCVRTQDGVIVANPESEGRNKIIYSIHHAVVKGPEDASPLFVPKQVASLLDNPKANGLLESLLTAVVAVNPDLKNG